MEFVILFLLTIGTLIKECWDGKAARNDTIRRLKQDAANKERGANRK